MMDTNKKTRILVVEDSRVIAEVLRSMINDTLDLEVIGVAKNGKEGVLMTQQLAPDLITMDIIMPEMDGFEATKSIMANNPTPIVVISSHLNNKELNTTFRALDAGALTVINKPTDVHSKKFELIQSYILDTIRSMSEVSVVKPPSPKKLEPSRYVMHETKKPTVHAYEVVALGASTGGPVALKTILSLLPRDFPLPILVVQHIADGFIGGFSEWLNTHIALEVKVAQEGEELKPGTVYAAPDNYHLTVERSNSTFGTLCARLVDSDAIVGFRPSITALFASLAETCAEHAIAGLLTGMGKDGLDGMKAMYLRNAHTFAQDAESTVIASMPNAACKAGVVDAVVELNDIANHLTQLVIKRG